MAIQEAAHISEAEDGELVMRARSGDRGAFSALAERHYERIHRTIYALVGDPDDADDLAQEAFLKAFRSLPRFRGGSRFYTWLYRIGVNCCLDWMKSWNRQGFVALEPGHWDGHNGSAPTQGASDVQVSRREVQEVLEGVLAGLLPEYRTAVVLREIDGLSYEEIASAMGCSVGTVKSRLFRAREQLRRSLEGFYGEWSAG